MTESHPLTELGSSLGRLKFGLLLFLAYIVSWPFYILNYYVEKTSYEQVALRVQYPPYASLITPRDIQTIIIILVLLAALALIFVIMYLLISSLLKQIRFRVRISEYMANEIERGPEKTIRNTQAVSSQFLLRLKRSSASLTTRTIYAVRNLSRDMVFAFGLLAFLATGEVVIQLTAFISAIQGFQVVAGFSKPK